MHIRKIYLPENCADSFLDIRLVLQNGLVVNLAYLMPKVLQLCSS